MKLFWIGYDLQSPGKDYRRLNDELIALGARKILYSDWVLRSSFTATQLRDVLQAYIDHNDWLMVAEVSNWASYNTLVDINNVSYANAR